MRNIWRQRAVPWTLLATTLLFFTLWVSAWLQPRTLDLNRTGNLAEWFAAVGTTGALVVIYIQLRREVTRGREAEIQRRRDPISAVRVWISGISRDRSGEWVMTVDLHNGGAVAIHDVWVRSYASRSTSSLSMDRHVDYVQVAEKVSQAFNGLAYFVPADGQRPKVEVTFRDPSGQPWIKDDLDTLNPMDQDDQARWHSHIMTYLGTGERFRDPGHTS